MQTLFRLAHWRTVAPPLTLCIIGVMLWWRYGFDPLNEFELPLAMFINGLTGRSEAFDYLVIFLNRWPGEASCVVIIFAAYTALAAWVLPKPIDWRRVILFACYIFLVWLAVDGIGDGIIEETMPRDSPSLLMGDGFVDLEQVREKRVKTVARTSFPSNHGGVFFTVFFMCLMRFGSRGWLLLPLAILLSSPRAFAGAHWMSDSLIGSVLVAWTMAALAVRTPVFRLHKRVEETLCEWWDRKAARR